MLLSSYCIKMYDYMLHTTTQSVPTTFILCTGHYLHQCIKTKEINNFIKIMLIFKQQII